MIRIKSKEEIAYIGRAGEIASEALRLVKANLRAGMSTWELDKLVREFIISKGAAPAFKDYKRFPGNICTSTNYVVVHGIPTKKEIIKEGDIISVDVGVNLDGYYADSAYTFGIDKISDIAKKLLQVTKEALYRGIDKAREGNRLGDISYSIQRHAESNGFSVVRDFVGHGIGHELHEDPEVPNYGEPNKGIRLEEGMMLALEPMVNQGSFYTKVLDDGWTVVTSDGLLSGHFEHTVHVTKGEPQVMTEWKNGDF